MKKNVIFVFVGLFFASCGPKRYGCGPYRRCEVKEVKLIKSHLEKHNC